jgi:hypothetical protein
MLDIEVVAAVCPKSTIAVYFSNFTEKGWIDVIDAALNDTRNRPSVLSISYGLAEGTEIWTDQAMSAINDSFKEAAARGIPVCISAGDDGSDDQVQDGMAHIDLARDAPDRRAGVFREAQRVPHWHEQVRISSVPPAGMVLGHSACPRSRCRGRLCSFPSCFTSSCR